MVARAQTVEDGGPRRPIHQTLHHEATPREFMRIEMIVRRPFSLLDFSQRLVVRASMVTGEITASLESVRIE